MNKWFIFTINYIKMQNETDKNLRNYLFCKLEIPTPELF